VARSTKSDDGGAGDRVVAKAIVPRKMDGRRKRSREQRAPERSSFATKLSNIRGPARGHR
jgi:hypothetical protein